MSLLLFGSTLLLGLYLSRARWLKAYGDWLRGPVTDSLDWEVLFVLSGRPFERGLWAAEAWRIRPVPIYLTGGLANDNLLAAGCPVHTECEMTHQALREFCVADSVIHLACEGTSTYEEIQLIRGLCLEKGYRKVGIVSSLFHGRRIHLLAQKHLAPIGIRARFVPAKPLLFIHSRWWKSEYGFLNAWEETLKLLYYWKVGLV